MLTEHLQRIDSGDFTIESAARELHRQLLIEDRLVFNKTGIVPEQTFQSAFENLVAMSWEGACRTPQGNVIRYVPINMSIDELVALQARSGLSHLSKQMAPYIAHEPAWADRGMKMSQAEHAIHPYIPVDDTPAAAIEHDLNTNFQNSNYLLPEKAIRLQLRRFGNPPNIHDSTRGAILIPIFNIDFQFPPHGKDVLNAYDLMDADIEEHTFATQSRALVNFTIGMFTSHDQAPATRYILAANFAPFDVLAAGIPQSQSAWMAGWGSNGDLYATFESMRAQNA